MNRLKYIVILVCAVMCLCLTACSNNTVQDENHEGNKYTIYFLDNNKFVTKDYYTKESDTAKLCENLMEAMGITMNLSGYSDEVSINKLNVANGVAYVYFNEAYRNMDNVYEVLFRASVVKTLSQLEDVNYVYFYVNNNALTYGNGQIIGLMEEGDFIADSDSDLSSLVWSEITLYFAVESGNRLVERNIDVAYVKTISMERLIVEQLIQGPDDDSLKGVIQPETRVLGTTVRGGICYVNLDESFCQKVPGVSYEATLYAVVNSLCELNNISKVQFQINGDSHREVNGFSFEQVYERNLDIIETGD